MQTLPVDVVDHTLSNSDELLAVDLDHGAGCAAQFVEWTYAGGETRDGSFGPGWADANVFRLAPNGSDTVIVRHGGLAWRQTFRDGWALLIIF